MNVIEAIKSRRSIRKYKQDEVPSELIDQMLECAHLAPSGNNTQPWHFIVVRDEELRKKFQAANHNQQWISGAPVLIVCVADLETRASDSTGLTLTEETANVELKKIIRDTAIAIDHLVLTAKEIGLSTCWLAWFEQKDIRPIFNIPGDKYVVAVVTVGYGDETPAPRPRKDVKQLVHYEKWS